MKIRSNSYELTKLNGNYDQVTEALKMEAMMHSIVGNREQFYMPGGKVTLQLRQVDDSVYLDVMRTSLGQPSYVKNILKKLGGKWTGSSERGVQPDKTIDLFVRTQ